MLEPVLRDIVSPRLRGTVSRRIARRLTKPSRLWTRGQVERMSRAIRAATVKHCHRDDQHQQRSQLADVLAAYIFARRFKTLNGPSMTSGSSVTSAAISGSGGIRPQPR